MSRYVQRVKFGIASFRADLPPLVPPDPLRSGSLEQEVSVLETVLCSSHKCHVVYNQS